MLRFFNQESFISLPSKIQVSPAGFRYGFLENVFCPGVYEELLGTFPAFDFFSYHEDDYKKVYEGPYYDSHAHRGCPHSLKRVPKIWKELLREASSEEFISLFRKVSGVDFNSLRNFSFKYGKNGCEIKPHLDQASRSGNRGASKLVSMWYFSEKEGPTSGGTCIYSSQDRKTILFEVSTLRNSMLFFEQHQEAWHGYEAIRDESRRKALALTFNTEPERIPIKTSLLHELFCLNRFRSPKESPSSKIDALMA